MYLGSTALLALVCLATAQQPQQLVTPPVASVMDGSHMYFVGGTVESRRQLTLIDGSLLSSMTNHVLTKLAFRRNADNEAFVGGDANLTIKLSHAARSWSSASDHFATNHGLDVTTVFQGQVTLPNSPAATTSTVAWTPDNIVEIVLQTPFLYLGGTLALEVTGSPDANNPVDWWPADAVWEPTGGTAVSVGHGCGPFGGPNSDWSFVTANNFVPGGTASFQALGSPGNLAFWVLAGATQPQALDLAVLGYPGCFVHMQYIIGNLFTFFGPPVLAQRPSEGGMARIELQLPPTPTLLGASLASQWASVGMNGLTTSNAHQWSIANQFPTLPMTLVTAPVFGTEPTIGKVIPACGHVIRFEYQ